MMGEPVGDALFLTEAIRGWEAGRGAQPTAALAARALAMMVAQLNDSSARPSEGGALASVAHLVEVQPNQCDKFVPHILSAMSPAGAPLCEERVDARWGGGGCQLRGGVAKERF